MIRIKTFMCEVFESVPKILYHLVVRSQFIFEN